MQSSVLDNWLGTKKHMYVFTNDRRLMSCAHLPAGAENPWTTWKALNRLRTQVDRSRVNMLKSGFSNEQETCDCGIHQAQDNGVFKVSDGQLD